MAQTREEIVKQNLEFVYGRNDQEKYLDPDKVTHRKVKPKFDDPDAIREFTGDNECLAPSFPCSVYLPEETEPYPSFEHALLASKYKTQEMRQTVRDTPAIRDVKRMISKEKGKASVLHADWAERCLSIAEILLVDKFVRHKALKMQLMKTGRRTLVFGNNFGDLFWGEDTSIVNKASGGKNNLGKLLEKVRGYIDRGEDLDLWMKHRIKLMDSNKVRVQVNVFKDGTRVAEDCKTFDQRAKLFFGKAEELADVVAAHPTVSRLHAVVVVPAAAPVPVPDAAAAGSGSGTGSGTANGLIVDLGSANGTKVNGVSIGSFLPTPIHFCSASSVDAGSSSTTGSSSGGGMGGDASSSTATSSTGSIITFGASTRQYQVEIDTEADVRRNQELVQKIAADPHMLQSHDPSDQQRCTVFVRNIPYTATEEDISKFFASCGEVTQLSVPKDRATGAPKGMAFVTFAVFAGVMQALARDGDELCGRNIFIKKSDARTSNSGSSTSNNNNNNNNSNNNARSHRIDRSADPKTSRFERNDASSSRNPYDAETSRFGSSTGKTRDRDSDSRDRRDGDSRDRRRSDSRDRRRRGSIGSRGRAREQSSERGRKRGREEEGDEEGRRRSNRASRSSSSSNSTRRSSTRRSRSRSNGRSRDGGRRKLVDRTVAATEAEREGEYSKFDARKRRRRSQSASRSRSRSKPRSGARSTDRQRHSYRDSDRRDRSETTKTRGRINGRHRSSSYRRSRSPSASAVTSSSRRRSNDKQEQQQWGRKRSNSRDRSIGRGGKRSRESPSPSPSPPRRTTTIGSS